MGQTFFLENAQAPTSFLDTSSGAFAQQANGVASGLAARGSLHAARTT